jgi:hypothetical protein
LFLRGGIKFLLRSAAGQRDNGWHYFVPGEERAAKVRTGSK